MKVLIIEDEELAATRLQKLLHQLDSSAEVLAVTDSIESSLAWLQNNPAPDLIFADIQLADGVSFEIFAQADPKTPIIFTTAYDQYALKAFRYNSIDYVLKPIKKPELEAALNKYKSTRQAATPAPDYKELLQVLSGQQPSYQKRFVIRFGQTIRTIEIADTAYFYTEEKITFAVTKDGKRWPLDHNLDELEEMLDPAAFFRINRQYILHISAIESMHAHSKSRVIVMLKPNHAHSPVVSYERSANFKQWLLGRQLTG